MTLQECAQKAEALLRTGPHPDRARADTEFLLRQVLRQDRAALLARWKEQLGESEGERYAELVKRRLTGEPIQYIVGETEFYGLPLHVTPDVLIPRPETEHSVEKAIALCRDLERPQIADVGTGSGAIAVALAYELQNAHLTAIDISPQALAIAKQNAERNGVLGRVRFIEGDLLAPVSGERFDLVVSNPPYVSTIEREQLAIEVRDYEPELALFAGADGMDIYRRLIPQAAGVLKRGGYLVLEIGYGQQPAVHALLEASRFADVEFVPDLQQIPRVAVGRLA